MQRVGLLNHLRKINAHVQQEPIELDILVTIVAQNVMKDNIMTEQCNTAKLVKADFQMFSNLRVLTNNNVET